MRTVVIALLLAACGPVEPYCTADLEIRGQPVRVAPYERRCLMADSPLWLSGLVDERYNLGFTVETHADEVEISPGHGGVTLGDVSHYGRARWVSRPPHWQISVETDTIRGTFAGYWP